MGVCRIFRACALRGSALFAIVFSTTAAAIAADTITLATPNPITTLDPMRSTSSGNIEVYFQLYSGLMRRNSQTGELEPALADRWEVSPDGLTYTLHLHDARFSDGSPITAEDVAFSLNRVHSDKQSVYPAGLSAVDTVTAADQKTVLIKLKWARSSFLQNLAAFNMGIVSKSDVEKQGDKAFTSDPVTSGPYIVKQWKPNEGIELRPNPHYWRAGHPKSDATIHFLETSSAETRIAMLRAGTVDAVRSVPWANIAELKKLPSIVVRMESSGVIYEVLLNHKREPFSDMKARQAAAYAIDNKAMTAALTYGYARPANTTLPDGFDFHDDAYPGIPQDIQKAKQLLTESGMQGHEVKILALPDATGQQTALLLQAQWQAIGLKPTIVNVDSGAWWDATGKADYDAAVSWWYQESPDPDIGVRWSVCGSCKSNAFNTFYKNPKVDDLIEEGAREADPAKRLAIYKEIQKITTQEVSQIPLYYAPNAVAYSKRVEGLKLTPSLTWTFEDTTLTK